MSGLEWTPDVSIYRQPWRENTGACLQAPAGEGITMTDRHPGEIDVGTAVLGLMSTKRVAELLEYSEKKVRRLIASGALEAIKDGGCLRVLPESLIEYKQRLRGDPKPVCERCGGVPPEGFICTGCGRASRVAS